VSLTGLQMIRIAFAAGKEVSNDKTITDRLLTIRVTFSNAIHN